MYKSKLIFISYFWLRYVKQKFFLLFSGIMTTMLLFTGCATTKLETKAKITRTISISPNNLVTKKVFLRVTGTDASILELEKPLKEALFKRGVTLVDNPDKANISLHVNTLFANNLKEAEHYKASAFAGAIAGGMAHARGNNTGDSILIGIGVALAMGLANHALADEIYRAVIDISVREKDNSSNNWLAEQKSRVLVEALKMNLDKQEAKPIMEKKAVYKIAEILS